MEACLAKGWSCQLAVSLEGPGYCSHHLCFTRKFTLSQDEGSQEAGLDFKSTPVPSPKAPYALNTTAILVPPEALPRCPDVCAQVMWGRDMVIPLADTACRGRLGMVGAWFCMRLQHEAGLAVSAGFCIPCNTLAADGHKAGPSSHMRSPVLFCLPVLPPAASTPPALALLKPYCRRWASQRSPSSSLHVATCITAPAGGSGSSLRLVWSQGRPPVAPTPPARLCGRAAPAPDPPQRSTCPTSE